MITTRTKYSAFWLHHLCLFTWFHGSWLCANEAVVTFPFDPAASVVVLDLGVSLDAAEGSQYKHGSRSLVGNGRMMCNVRFEGENPVAIQPINVAALMARRALEWSFLFDVSEGQDSRGERTRRSVEVRGLNLISVNEFSLPWFPIDESGRFNVDQIEFEASGVIFSDGSNIDPGRTDLADQWSFDLDLEGRLVRIGKQLQLEVRLNHSVVVDDGSIDAELGIDGKIVGLASHPFARPRLEIRIFSSSREVQLSWEPPRDYTLQQDTSPLFQNPITHTVSSHESKLRIPMEDDSKLFFRLLDVE